MEKKTSIIWKISSEILQNIVNESKTYTEVLNYFGFDSSNLPTLKNRLLKDHIKYEHLKTNNINQIVNVKTKIDIDTILVENSKVSRCHLKKRLISEGYLKYICSVCGIDEWRGCKLSLQLDHINGINDDNRLENLRLLCPNCHSCTDTFSGRNIEKRKKRLNCQICGKKVVTKSLRCRSCANKIEKPKLRKVERPSAEQLQRDINARMPLTRMGTKYGVSDNAVRKWLKSYNINWK
jgi:hypothetical protein